jgi:hypothetical protein
MTKDSGTVPVFSPESAERKKLGWTSAQRDTFFGTCFFQYYSFGCKITGMDLLYHFHIVAIEGGYCVRRSLKNYLL